LKLTNLAKAFPFVVLILMQQFVTNAFVFIQTDFEQLNAFKSTTIAITLDVVGCSAF